MRKEDALGEVRDRAWCLRAATCCGCTSPPLGRTGHDRPKRGALPGPPEPTLPPGPRVTCGALTAGVNARARCSLLPRCCRRHPSPLGKCLLVSDLCGCPLSVAGLHPPAGSRPCLPLPGGRGYGGQAAPQPPQRDSQLPPPPFHPTPKTLPWTHWAQLKRAQPTAQVPAPGPPQAWGEAGSPYSMVQSPHFFSNMRFLAFRLQWFRGVPAP